MTYKKNYIGKGRKVENRNTVKVTLKMSELEKFAYEYHGEMMINVEIAELQQTDKYGRTHTAYVVTREENKEIEKLRTQKVPHLTREDFEKHLDAAYFPGAIESLDEKTIAAEWKTFFC